MPRLVPGMRVWNKAAGLKHKENGNALLLMFNREKDKVLVKTDCNFSYYWWRSKATFPATNQPNPIVIPNIPSNAFNQATHNRNRLVEDAYLRDNYGIDRAFNR